MGLHPVQVAPGPELLAHTALPRPVSILWPWLHEERQADRALSSSTSAGNGCIRRLPLLPLWRVHTRTRKIPRALIWGLQVNFSEQATLQICNLRMDCTSPAVKHEQPGPELACEDDICTWSRSRACSPGMGTLLSDPGVRRRPLTAHRLQGHGLCPPSRHCIPALEGAHAARWPEAGERAGAQAVL